MSEVLEVTEATFDQEILNSEQPVLVDYWAPWCGPCKMLMPIVEQVAAERNGTLKFGKVNVDENEAIMARYGIRGVPTLMLFKNGEVVAARSGAMPKAQLDAFINQHL